VAARREILLARIMLQRARLQRDVALLEAAAQGLPAALCVQAISAWLEPAAAAVAAAAEGRGTRPWLRWLAIALQVARGVAELRRSRATAGTTAGSTTNSSAAAD
jgi:hypothetical protein